MQQHLSCLCSAAICFLPFFLFSFFLSFFLSFFVFSPSFPSYFFSISHLLMSFVQLCAFIENFLTYEILAHIYTFLLFLFLLLSVVFIFLLVSVPPCSYLSIFFLSFFLSFTLYLSIIYEFSFLNFDC